MPPLMAGAIPPVVLAPLVALKLSAPAPEFVTVNVIPVVAPVMMALVAGTAFRIPIVGWVELTV